jgi:hypothetical protein
MEPLATLSVNTGEESVEKPVPMSEKSVDDVPLVNGMADVELLANANTEFALPVNWMLMPVSVPKLESNWAKDKDSEDGAPGPVVVSMANGSVSVRVAALAKP